MHADIVHADIVHADIVHADIVHAESKTFNASPPKKGCILRDYRDRRFGRDSTAQCILRDYRDRRFGRDKYSTVYTKRLQRQEIW